MRFVWKNRRRQIKSFYKILCILIVFIIIFLLVDAKIRPMVRSLAEAKARNTLTKITNEIVNDLMRDESLTYDSLVILERNSYGEVTSVQANVSKMNQIKAEISTRISDRIKTIDKEELKIALGTILGSDLLSGRGPKIKVLFSLSGDVTTEIVNKFDSAGINQTRHQIMLDIYADIYIVLPGDKTSTNLKTNLIIAETVIVGNVPSTYANMNGFKENELTQK